MLTTADRMAILNLKLANRLDTVSHWLIHNSKSNLMHGHNGEHRNNSSWLSVQWEIEREIWAPLTPIDTRHIACYNNGFLCVLYEYLFRMLSSAIPMINEGWRPIGLCLFFLMDVRKNDGEGVWRRGENEQFRLWTNNNVLKWNDGM